jgi:molybdate transport system substrate-binding protein
LSAEHWVSVEATGGVDAKQRVNSGEVFDVVVLASDAIDELTESGHLIDDSKVDLLCSGVAVAVRAGTPRPDVSSEEALKRAVLAADSIGCSTGPSGVALMNLFERWGIADEVRARIVTAPPGVPVGALVRSGEMALGFQQRSELMHMRGISVIAMLPPAVQIVTTFSAGVGRASPDSAAAKALISFLASPVTSDAKLRHGMYPP